jgi:hypothetical protein
MELALGDIAQEIYFAKRPKDFGKTGRLLVGNGVGKTTASVTLFSCFTKKG